MNYNELLDTVINLKFDKPVTIYSDDGVEIYIVRPSKVFKNYDINKNFQIFIKDGLREFKPNHLRVMIDLNLRVRSRPDLKEQLLMAFDKIFYRKGSLEAVEGLKKEKFEHYLNSINIIAVLSQLFIIEQDYNYEGLSHFEPATLFYQGWVRQFLDSTKEIDNLCMSVCNRQPPAVKYTSLENKKHKKYNSSNPYLWYLN